MRYYTTVEVAELFKKSNQYAWWVMHNYGYQPLGRDVRTLVWRGEDVRRVHKLLQMSGRQRATQERILQGIQRRKAKREAAQLKGA